MDEHTGSILASTYLVEEVAVQYPATSSSAMRPWAVVQHALRPEAISEVKAEAVDRDRVTTTHEEVHVLDN